MYKQIQTTNIKFELSDFNKVQSCDTNEEQPKANHYKKIQETEEGQNLIRQLADVINSIGNIDNFTNALRQYITKYALLKEKKPCTNFKIRDIKFEYGNSKDATLNEIIITTFNGNKELIELYGGIIDQFDRVCDDLDRVFNVSYLKNEEVEKNRKNRKNRKKQQITVLDTFEDFMNNLSLQTISPLTIELCNQIIKDQIDKISDAINTQRNTQEVTNRLNVYKNKFIYLQNGTETFRKELKTGLSHEKEDSAFKDFNGHFKKDSNYLALVQDEYKRNYLHYAWKHFEGVSATNNTLNNIKARLLEYAGNKIENIKQACQEKDVYGLTPLCYVLIDAFDNGITNDTVKTELSYILNYFKDLGVSTQLNQKELQAIYDYFQITTDIRGDYRNYDKFIDIFKDRIQKTHDNKIPDVKINKNYKPQIKYKADTHKEQVQSNNLSIETFLSDDGDYKDKVGDFVDTLFKEIYNTDSLIYEDRCSDKYKEYYMNKKYKTIYSVIADIFFDTINSIKQDEKLKYIQADSGKNIINRNTYCISLFIKALEQKYNENNNPDIMFKFLSDFCESDMGIKMDRNNYIQIIKYFLDNSDKINDDVKQNIKSLIRYMIKTDIVNDNDFQINTRNENTFIQQITTKNSGGIFSKEEQEIIQDIILTAINNNINFKNSSQQLIYNLFNIGFSNKSNVNNTTQQSLTTNSTQDLNNMSNKSNVNNTTQQNLSTFTIVKNLILSGNVTETENFSQYSGLTNDEKVKLQQILAKTVAITKIIKEGKQDCSKLKDAVVNFISGDADLTIEDITKIKVNHKSISKFCEGKVSTNTKCAYYSWFLNKLVVNNYIANNSSSNTIERSESKMRLIQGNGQQTITPTNIIMDTYDEFEKYKNNFVKKNKNSISHRLFRVIYMGDSNINIAKGKRSGIHYQNIRSVHDYEQQFNNGEASRTLKNILSSEEDIQTDLEKYKLQQQVNANKEKSE